MDGRSFVELSSTSSPLWVKGATNYNSHLSEADSPIHQIAGILSRSCVYILLMQNGSITRLLLVFEVCYFQSILEPLIHNTSTPYGQRSRGGFVHTHPTRAYKWPTHNLITSTPHSPTEVWPARAAPYEAIFRTIHSLLSHKHLLTPIQPTLDEAI